MSFFRSLTQCRRTASAKRKALVKPEILRTFESLEARSLMAWDFIDTVEVKTDGSYGVSQAVLESNVQYKLIAKGQAKVASGRLLDAEFFETNTLSWEDSSTYLGVFADHGIKTNLVTTWGDKWSYSGEYEQIVTGDGSALTARYEDNNYSDNWGSLTVDIYRYVSDSVSVEAIENGAIEPDQNNANSKDGSFRIYRTSTGSESSMGSASDNYSKSINVDYEFLSTSTATFGDDYRAYIKGSGVYLTESGTVTIPAGESSVEIIITPLTDDIDETYYGEYVDMQISVPTGSEDDFIIVTDTDYLHIADHITIDKPTCEEGGCDCQCGGAQTCEDTGNSSSNAANGKSMLQGNSGTRPSIQAPATIPAMPNWSSVASIRASAIMASATIVSQYYSPSGVVAGDQVSINMLVDASGLSSGATPWTITLDYLDASGNVLHSEDYRGLTTVVNRLESEYGNRWWRTDLDQLAFTTNYVTLIAGTGSTVEFFTDGTRFYRVSANDDRLSLKMVGSDYVLKDKHGNQSLFDSSGKLLSRTTVNGLVTTYEYVSGTNLLEYVTTPDGDVTRYTYETYAGTKSRVATMIEHYQILAALTTTFTYESSSSNVLLATTTSTADMVPVVKTTSFTYDATTKLLTTATDSENNVTTINYDFAGRVDSIEQPCGGTTALDPHSSIGLFDVTVTGNSPSNLATFVKLDDPNAVGVSEDERGNTTRFRLNNQGKTVWEEDALGQVTTYEYDTAGNLVRMVEADPDGIGALEAVETLYKYDALGNVVSRIERALVSQSLLSEETWTFEPVFGRMTSHTDEYGRKTFYIIGEASGDINDDGRVIAEIQIVGLDDRFSSESNDLKTSTTYGSVAYGSLVIQGLVTSRTDVLGRTTSYEYFDNVAPTTGKLGLLKKVTNPDSSYREYDYDSHGNRTSEKDELGHTTTYAYDQFNRLIQMTEPDPDGSGTLVAPINRYAYDLNDNMTKSTDPLGRVTQMVYNNRSWLSQKIEPGNVTTSYTYDCVGNLKTVTDPLGRVTTYDYDELNRQYSVTLADPDGAGPFTSPVTTKTYDALGRVASSSDANGNVTTYGYDQDGRQISVTLPDPDGAGPLTAPIMSTQYNERGQVVATTDALGVVTRFGYDELGRQTMVLSAVADPAATVYDQTVELTSAAGWTSVSGSGSGGSYLTRTNASSNDWVTWTLTGLDPTKDYEVLTTWVADSDNSSSASYVVTGANSQSVSVDQRYVPQDGERDRISTSGSDLWERLTAIKPKSDGTLTVRLHADPNGRVVADAVRVVEVGSVSRAVYDKAGRVFQSINALGQVTQYKYDNRDRATEVLQVGSAGLWSETLVNSTAYTTYPNFNTIPTTSAAVTNINFAAADLAPNTATRYIGLVYVPVSDTVSFKLTATARARLFIDEIDSGASADAQTGTGSSASSATYSKYLTAGYHNIRIEYYNGTGSSEQLKLEWDPISGGTTTYASIADNLFQVARSATVYDAGSRVTKTIDSLGQVTDFAYDNLDRRTSVTLPDPDGPGGLARPVMSSTYDAVGNVTSTKDALGLTTYYVYDELNRQTKVMQPVTTGTVSGIIIDQAGTGYNQAGSYTSVSGSGGWNNNYRVLPASGSANYARYSFTGLDPNKTYQVVVTYKADAANSNAANYVVSGVVGSTLTSLANTNINQQLAPGDMPTGSTSISGWERLGVVTGFSSYRVQLNTNSTNQVIADAVQFLEVGPVSTTNYDAAGQVTNTVDALSRVTSYGYDNLGRNISVTLPDPDGVGSLTSPVSYTSYDGNGNVLTTTDALGNVTSYEYDALNRRITTTQADPDGAGPLTSPVWETVYNVASQIVASIDPLGRTTTYEYDQLGRQIVATSPDSDGAGSAIPSQSEMVYDVLGNLLQSKQRKDDLSYLTTSYAYDGFNRATTVTNPNGEATKYTFDPNGRQISLTDSQDTDAVTPGVQGNTTTWRYDRLGRMVVETNPLGETRSYVYDVASRMTSKTDRLGRVVSYVYDNLNRLTEEKWDGASAYTWAYDAVGQVLNVGAADVNVVDYQYTYDKLGRLSSLLLAYNPTGYQKRTNYTYNQVGSLLEKYEYGTGDGWTSHYVLGSTDYTYDNLQRQTRLRSWDNSYRYQRADFTYNAAGQMETIDRHDTYASFISTSNATLLVHSDYDYDGAGRLTSIFHEDPNGNPFASYGYTWDAVNRITNVDFLDGVYDDEDVSYSYDDAGQVMGADRTGSGAVQDESYSYDGNGNRQSVTRDGVMDAWGATSNNRLSTDGVYNYHYDDEGNMTSRVKLDSFGAETSERREFSWDHRNRLTLVSDYDSSNTLFQTVAFSYNHENLLVYRILGDGTTTVSDTTYEFNGNELSVDYGEIHSPLAYSHRIVYGPMTDLALFDVTGPVDSDGVYALVGDHLNTVRDMVRRNASTGDFEHVNHIQYDSFGGIKDQSYTGSDLVLVIGFTGRYYERYTGLQNNWNRWYDSNAGRWISEDPIGFAGGDKNLGRYAGNASITHVDANGLSEDLYDWGQVLDSDRYALAYPLIYEPELKDTVNEQIRRMKTYNYDLASELLSDFLNSKNANALGINDKSKYSHYVSKDNTYRDLAQKYFSAKALEYVEYGKKITVNLKDIFYDGVNLFKSPFYIDWVPPGLDAGSVANYKRDGVWGLFNPFVPEGVGKNEHLFFAIGGGNIGHKNATMTIDATNSKSYSLLENIASPDSARDVKEYCINWSVKADMQLWDAFRFPSDGLRMKYGAYAAASYLEKYHNYNGFVTTMSWEDTFSGNLNTIRPVLEPSAY